MFTVELDASRFKYNRAKAPLGEITGFVKISSTNSKREAF